MEVRKGKSSTGGVRTLMPGAHMGYFFYTASSAVLSPPPSSDLTHWLGPWKRLTVQTKPHLIFLCHDFYSFAQVWHQ